MLAIMRKWLLQILAGAAIVLLYGNCSKSSESAAQTGAGGSTARFTISGNYLYVVDHSSLKTFSIANPENPVLKSKTEIGINIETIFPYQDKLFIGSSFSMYIFSLTSPERPVQIAKADYEIRMACDPVVAKDGVAYATLRASGPCGGSQSALVVYNTTDISKPVLAKTVNLQGPYGLGLKDNALYVCEGALGIRVFDIADKYNPVQVSTLEHDETYYDVIPYGNILIAQAASGIVLYDTGADPLQPVFISKITQ